MGEIAELMLEGALCSMCGEILDDPTAGVPQMCAGCASDDEEE